MGQYNQSKFKCLEFYQVNVKSDISDLPIKYRTNRSIKIMVQDYALMINAGLIYAFDRTTGKLEVIFNAFTRFAINNNLTAFFKGMSKAEVKQVIEL